MKIDYFLINHSVRKVMNVKGSVAATIRERLEEDMENITNHLKR
jgi:hypothetical protein